MSGFSTQSVRQQRRVVEETLTLKLPNMLKPWFPPGNPMGPSEKSKPGESILSLKDIYVHEHLPFGDTNFCRWTKIVFF